MFLERNMTDLNDILLALSANACFSRPDPAAAFEDYLRLAGASQIQVQYRSWDTTSPGILLGVTDKGWMTWSQGCQSVGQGTEFYKGYIFQVGDQVANPSNRWINAAAENITFMLRNTSLPLVGVPWHVGYSIGGCLATAYAQNTIERLGYQPNVLTFGSPRTLGGRFSTALNLPGGSLRLMTDADPIPLLPLRFQDNPSQALLLTSFQLRAIQNYSHVAGGVSIDSVGNMTAAELPPLSEANATSSIASWLFGLDNGQTGVHALTTYSARLTLAIAASRRGIPAPPRAAPVEPPNPVTPRQETQTERRAVQSIFNRGEAQNAQPAIQPPQSDVVAFRDGSVWMVAWRDQIIGIGPTKRRARAMARELNAFLRRLQTMAFVNTDETAGLMTSYLADATDPTKGFSPIVQDQLPTEV